MAVNTELWLTGSVEEDKLIDAVKLAPRQSQMQEISEVFIVSPDAEDDGECVGENIVVHNSCLLPFYVPGRTILAFDDEAKIVSRMTSIETIAVPMNVRGDLTLNRFFLSIGPSRLTRVDNDNVTYLPFNIGYCFWGRSTPTDAFVFEDSLKTSAEFKSLHSELETLFGPIQIDFLYG